MYKQKVTTFKILNVWFYSLFCSVGGGLSSGFSGGVSSRPIIINQAPAAAQSVSISGVFGGDDDEYNNAGISIGTGISGGSQPVYIGGDNSNNFNNYNNNNGGFRVIRQGGQQIGHIGGSHYGHVGGSHYGHMGSSQIGHIGGSHYGQIGGSHAGHIGGKGKGFSGGHKSGGVGGSYSIIRG